jgi:hypothetical protein
MTEILELIESYINMSYNRQGILIPDSAQEFIEYIKLDSHLVSQEKDLKNNILSKINNDENLFLKYLSLSLCIKSEKYEFADKFKNEIFNYQK